MNYDCWQRRKRLLLGIVVLLWNERLWHLPWENINLSLILQRTFNQTKASEKASFNQLLSFHLKETWSSFLVIFFLIRTDRKPFTSTITWGCQFQYAAKVIHNIKTWCILPQKLGSMKKATNMCNFIVVKIITVHIN